MEQILNTILLYSLALGLLLAVSAGLTLIFTRSSSPLLRYRILVSLLVLFTTGIATAGFFKLRDFNPAEQPARVQTITEAATTTRDSEIAGTNPITAATTDLLTISRNFLDSNARTIALIWVLIVLAKGIKLTSNLFELHYLKTRKIYPAGKHWEDQVARLSRLMGLSKTVRVMQSGLVQVPVVLGHFKPLILIPLGMITAIKPQEIEMMILHELAHVKRMDFMVNILQHILELLFFFNPAVLWVSALIRKERENCCDEMVLQNADERISYIQALLSFKEYQLNVPAYAMAFAKESSIVSRVKRIVYQKNTALNSIEKGCLLIAILLFCSFSMLRATEQMVKPVIHQEPDTKKAKSQAKPAPTSRKSAASKQTPAHTAKKTTAPEAPEKNETIAEKPAEPEITLNLNTNTNTSGNVSVNIDSKLLGDLATNLTNTVISAVNMALDSNQHYSAATIKLDNQPEVSVRTGLNTLASPDSKVKLNPQAKLNPQPKNGLLLKVEPKDSGLTEDLIKALEKAGIDTKGEQFRFHLSNKELTVNGKKQTEAVKNAVLKNFLKSSEDTIDFSYNRDGKSISTTSSYITR